MCFAPQQRALFRHRMALESSKSGRTPCLFNMFTSKCASRHSGVDFFLTSQLPKLVRDRRFLALFTSTCASRHNGGHFFDITTSKSALRMVVCDTFDFKMCFAPQRRATFHVSSGPLPLIFSISWLLPSDFLHA